MSGHRTIFVNLPFLAKLITTYYQKEFSSFLLLKVQSIKKVSLWRAYWTQFSAWLVLKEISMCQISDKEKWSFFKKYSDQIVFSIRQLILSKVFPFSSFVTVDTSSIISVSYWTWYFCILRLRCTFMTSTVWYMLFHSFTYWYTISISSTVSNAKKQWNKWHCATFSHS